MHNRLKTARSSEGFTLTELLVVLALIACIATLGAFATRQVMMRKQCKRNLQTIYNALEMYEMDRGTLPRLAFFPDSPRTEKDSPLVALRTYSSSADIYVCPSAPTSHRELGITYIWNVTLNGRKMHGAGEPAWMMTEMSALSETIPPPHLGMYNVLYTDGHVRKSKTPPEALREM